MNFDFDQVVDRNTSNTAKYTQRKSVFGCEDILPMWVADMDIVCPPFILEAIQQRAQHPVFGYVDKPKAAIAAQIEWMERRQGYVVDEEWVLSCHSIVTSIHIALQAFSSVGDEVIIMPPVYHEFSNSIKQENRQILHWPLTQVNGRYQFSIDVLKPLISAKTRILILCSPHNPIGRVWTRQELRTIGDFCLENGIIIIADEMHSDLVYQPHIFYPMATISQDIAAQCITLQGPGKTFNLTGLGLSSVIIRNLALREKFTKVYQQNHPSYGTVFSQVAFEAGYRNGENWLNALLLYINKNQLALQDMLSMHGSKITMVPSEATFLAWLNCSGLNLSAQELKTFFIHKAKLGLSPGTQFGPGGEQFMRLNFAVPHSVMNQAITQLSQALKK